MPELSILYRDIAPGAAEATTPSSDDKQSFSDLSDMLSENNTAPQHATFEDDYWQLGQGFKLFPSNPAGLTWGFFSQQMSDADGDFDEPITLTLSLSALFSAVDLSLKFDKYGPTWCTDLDIEWYRDNTLLHSQSYQPDGWKYICTAAVENFNKIVFTFNKLSHAYRFLKVQSIAYGTTILVGSEDISETDMHKETDLISDTIAVSTFDFSLLKSDNVSYIFQRKQLMKVKHGNRNLGDFYISNSSKSRNKYSIQCVNVFGLLDMAGKHMGGFYQGESAFSVLSDILGGVPGRIDTAIAFNQVYGYLPIADRRENLRQLAFSLGAMALPNDEGGITIRRTSSTTAKNIGNNRTYENGSVLSEAPVTEVKLIAYSYSQGSDESTLFDGVLTGSVEIEFSEPMSELQISGGTIVRSGVNYAVISGAGSPVILTGTPYVCTQRIFSQANPLRNANDADNVLSFEGMTLVNHLNADDVLEACFDRSMRNERIETKILLDGEMPGDYVQIYTEDGTRAGHIISMDYTISNKLAADVVVLAEQEGDEPE